MFNSLMNRLKEIAISEAMEICEKGQFMDSALFYSKIKDMTVQEIQQISMDIILTHTIKEMNKGFVVTKRESILKKVM